MDIYRAKYYKYKAKYIAKKQSMNGGAKDEPQDDLVTSDEPVPESLNEIETEDDPTPLIDDQPSVDRIEQVQDIIEESLEKVGDIVGIELELSKDYGKEVVEEPVVEEEPVEEKEESKQNPIANAIETIVDTGKKILNEAVDFITSDSDSPDDAPETLSEIDTEAPVKTRCSNPLLGGGNDASNSEYELEVQLID